MSFVNCGQASYQSFLPSGLFFGHHQLGPFKQILRSWIWFNLQIHMLCIPFKTPSVSHWLLNKHLYPSHRFQNASAHGSNFLFSLISHWRLTLQKTSVSTLPCNGTHISISVKLHVLCHLSTVHLRPLLIENHSHLLGIVPILCLPWRNRAGVYARWHGWQVL